MKEINEKMFECEYCNKKFDNPRDAEDCEKEHIHKNRLDKIERLTEFTIEDKHIKLLGRMNVNWWACEFGAPCIDPKRPYGNSDVVDDVAEIIRLKKKDNYDYENEDWKEEIYDKLYYLHREMMIVLQIILSTGQIKKGTYVKTNEYDYQSWKFKDVSGANKKC